MTKKENISSEMKTVSTKLSIQDYQKFHNKMKEMGTNQSTLLRRYIHEGFKRDEAIYIEQKTNDSKTVDMQIETENRSVINIGMAECLKPPLKEICTEPIRKKVHASKPSLVNKTSKKSSGFDIEKFIGVLSFVVIAGTLILCIKYSK